MKALRTALALLAALCLMLAAAGSGAETYVDANRYCPDQTIYRGNWRDLYLQVLQEHSSSIHLYQNRTIDFQMDGARYSVPCFPVSLTDLNGDGIPELLFLETAGGGDRGDLWIYSGNGSTARCALYVPGISRLDYDDMLGFEIFLQNGRTLVIKHYRYENEWYLWFYVNSEGQYDLIDYMNYMVDASGEGDGWFYRNGRPISLEAYVSATDTLHDAEEERWITEYFSRDYHSYGLNLTYENAVSMLSSASISPQEPVTPARRGGDVYGLTIDKIATRKGPGTQYQEGGTYSVKGQYIKVLAKAYDKRNGIWWVKCEIPYRNEIRVLWTGYKRFDHGTLSLDDLPEEFW